MRRLLLARNLSFLLFLAFILAACTPPEDPMWTGLAMVDGEPVALDSGRSDELPEHLVTEDDGLNWIPASFQFSSQFGLEQVEAVGGERCLADVPNICVRTIQHRVEESDDGGSSWRTVWELDLSGNWLSRQLGTYEKASSRPGSVLETPGGTILVAVGSLPPIRRSSEGTWSPTEGDLRRFPMGGAVLGSVGLLTLIASLAARPASARLAFAGSTGICIGWMALVQTKSDATINSAFLLFALFVVTTLGQIISAFSRPRPDRPRKWLAPPPTRLLPIAVLNGGLLSWSQDWLKWQLMLGLTIVSIGAMVSRSMIKPAEQDRNSHPKTSSI